MSLSKAYREREQDILDKYALKQITRNEAGKLLTDLYADHYDAQSSLRLADECNQTHTQTVKDKANAS